MKTKLFLLSILTTMLLLTGCQSYHTIDNMKFIKSENDSKYYDVGYLQNSEGETFKFYLLKDDIKMMTIGSLYNITYVNDSDEAFLDDRNYTVTKIAPSNLAKLGVASK